MLTPLVTQSNDINRVHRFLLRNSDTFTPPLASRIDLSEYARKLTAKATNIFLSINEIDIGHAGIYYNSQSKSFISSFCIDHAYQRMGLANMLMAEIVKECSNISSQQIEIEVALNNKRAFSFYLKQGFVEQQKNEDTAIMIKNI